MDREIAKLVARIAYNLPDMDAEAMKFWIKRPKKLRKFLSGLNPPKADPVLEPVLDFIVRVDRSTKPTYRYWHKELKNPELELAGPAEYNLQDGVEQWLHPDQNRRPLDAKTIYKHLQTGDALATCLNLQDGLAIQAKGVAVFRKLFAGKKVFLWGSVAEGLFDYSVVPYLVFRERKVMVCWERLSSRLGSKCPALRFRK